MFMRGKGDMIQTTLNPIGRKRKRESSVTLGPNILIATYWWYRPSVYSKSECQLVREELRQCIQRYEALYGRVSGRVFNYEGPLPRHQAMFSLFPGEPYYYAQKYFLATDMRLEPVIMRLLLVAQTLIQQLPGSFLFSLFELFEWCGCRGSENDRIDLEVGDNRVAIGTWTSHSILRRRDCIVDVRD